MTSEDVAARRWAEAVMGICNIDNDVGQLDYITSRFQLAMAQARAAALEDAAKVAEKRSQELGTVYTMHNGLNDIRGAAAAFEVAALIRMLKEAP